MVRKEEKEIETAFECNVCAKVFDTIRALTGHQSLKLAGEMQCLGGMGSN